MKRSRSDMVNQLMFEVERSSGIIHLSDDISDDVAEMFLDEILGCELCAEAEAMERRNRPHGFPPSRREH